MAKKILSKHKARNTMKSKGYGKKAVARKSTVLSKGRR